MKIAPLMVTTEKRYSMLPESGRIWSPLFFKSAL
jgi:hypothetical protein